MSCRLKTMINLPESDEELLRECEVETFRSGGSSSSDSGSLINGDLFD